MADMGTDSSSKDETKPMCKYGESCYRKNKQHLSQFRHTKRKGDARTAVKENPAKKRKIESPTKQKKSSSDSSTKITSPGDEEDDVKKIEKDEEERKESESKDEALPPAPSDVREEIKMKFLVEMPEDFYEFWEFCKSLDARNPT
ncbi:uncharacterized protein LOC102801100, partial [Saccoglossus kowalevskii]|uniref:UPF0609 protein CG1218-like n=1 Tax=Saccoglossus kowalevskii TaxID=10224 RepID=A0ABM0MQK4_SACKO